MKKHILVNHYAALMNRYFGHRNQNEKSIDGSMYYCKMCNLPAQTCEHLLYHILSSEKHKELDMHIKPFVFENDPTQKRLHNLAPKAEQTTISNNTESTIASPTAAQNPISTATSSGTVLLAAQNNTTALLCASGPRQMYIPSQASAKNVLLSNAAVTTLQNPSQTPTRLPAPTVVKTGFSMFVPNLTSNTSKQVPITVRVPGLPQTQSGQVLLPPGVQINVPGKMGLRPSQPLLVTHNVAMNQSASQPPILSSQSIRLIPTGNNVNGVPTYTLAPVQVTVPVQPGGAQVVGKGSVVLTQNNITTARQLNTARPPGATGLTAEQKLALSRSKSNELAVLSPFIRSENKMVRCLKCKILLTEKGIFHHLLHGLKCLFCPSLFYSVKQIMEHASKEHSLWIKGNRDFLKKEYQLDTNEQGHLVFTSFDLNTNIPKEQLGDKELNLVLVTSNLEKIFMKMYPESPKVVGTVSAKHFSSGCPLCQVKTVSKEDYDLHLKTKHHIMPTIHAILKTPAFKCIYCLGVYTERFTAKTISIHVQRCRCAPKPVKDAERLINPDPNIQVANGEVSQLIVGGSAAGNKVNGMPSYGFAPIQLKTPALVGGAQHSSKGPVVVMTKLNPTTILGGKMVHKDPRSGQSKGKGRESPASKGRVKPKGGEVKSQQARRELLNKYFNQKPYLSEAEVETLAARLWLKRPDVVAAFAKKQNVCMKAINTKRTAVLLGFNMTEMKKVKHNVLIPEAAPANASVDVSVQTQVTVKLEDSC